MLKCWTQPCQYPNATPIWTGPRPGMQSINRSSGFLPTLMPQRSSLLGPRVWAPMKIPRHLMRKLKWILRNRPWTKSSMDPRLQEDSWNFVGSLSRPKTSPKDRWRSWKQCWSFSNSEPVARSRQELSSSGIWSSKVGIINKTQLWVQRSAMKWWKWLLVWEWWSVKTAGRRNF